MILINCSHKPKIMKVKSKRKIKKKSGHLASRTGPAPSLKKFQQEQNLQLTKLKKESPQHFISPKKILSLLSVGPKL